MDEYTQNQPSVAATQADAEKQLTLAAAKAMVEAAEKAAKEQAVAAARARAAACQAEIDVVLKKHNCILACNLPEQVKGALVELMNGERVSVGGGLYIPADIRPGVLALPLESKPS